jgi:5-methylcytosine-specific restriction endonuclease McrA
MEYRSFTRKIKDNSYTKIHLFNEGDYESVCGWTCRPDTEDSSREEFLNKKKCPPCNRFYTGKETARKCVRCKVEHKNGSDWKLKDKIAYLRRRDGDNCGVCHFPIDYDEDKLRHQLGPSVDHILERRNNGCGHVRNLRLTHGICNWQREQYEDRPFDNPHFPMTALKKLAARHGIIVPDLTTIELASSM